MWCAISACLCPILWQAFFFWFKQTILNATNKVNPKGIVFSDCIFWHNPANPFWPIRVLSHMRASRQGCLSVFGSPHPAAFSRTVYSPRKWARRGFVPLSAERGHKDLTTSLIVRSSLFHSYYDLWCLETVSHSADQINGKQPGACIVHISSIYYQCIAYISSIYYQCIAYISSIYCSYIANVSLNPVESNTYANSVSQTPSPNVRARPYYSYWK